MCGKAAAAWRSELVRLEQTGSGAARRDQAVADVRKAGVLMRSTLLVLAATVLLASCGARGPLEPPPRIDEPVEAEAQRLRSSTSAIWIRSRDRRLDAPFRTIATACSMPRTSPLPEIAGGGRHAVLLLFDRDADAALPGVRRGVRRAWTHHDLLRDEGQFQPGGAAHARPSSAPAWTWCPRASSGGRWLPACRARGSCSPASARRRARWRCALEGGIHCFNVESEPELELLIERRRRGSGTTRAGLAPGQSRCRRQDPRQDLHRARPRTSSAFRLHAARASLCRMPRSCPASRSPASTCISAARSPTSRPSTTPSAAGRADRELRADGHDIRACRSRRRARHSLPATTMMRRRCPTTMRDDRAASTLGHLGCKFDARAGPADRRQCRHPASRG